MNRFEGRVALVTGSTQGVGEAVALRLAAEGAAGVVITGRNEHRGREVVERLTSTGSRAIFVSADLTDDEAPERLLNAAADEFGRVDHLANCAGLTDRGTVWDTSGELWDRIMAVNVRAPFFLIQGVARLARDNGSPASVVNVGSVSGYGGASFLTPYSVSKGALNTMTKNVAYALMRDGVRVNTVNPGWMDTPGEHAIQRDFHGADDDWLEVASAKQPFGRLISVDELVSTLLFVLSDEAGMMTGAIIDYDQSVTGAGPQPVPPPGT